MRPLALVFRLLVAAALVAPPLLARAGEPILLPDITPGSTSEFGIAFMLQERVELALERDGHVVLTAEAVRPVVGDAVDQCADVSGCPYAALRQLPAALAVVIRVSRIDGALHAEVALYDAGDSKPLETKQYVIQSGAEEKFARAVADVTADILTMRPPSSGDAIRAAVALVDAADAAEAQPEEPAPEPPEPEAPPAAAAAEPEQPPQPEPVPEPDLSELSFEERLAGTGISPRYIAGSKNHFMKSELDPRDWLYKAMPHAGRVVIEVRGGIGIGDVDRAADVRVVVRDDYTVVDDGEWVQEGPVDAERVRGGLYVGYAPVTWFDFGVLFGLQYGQKQLTTGWRREGDDSGPSGDAEPVQALQIYVQPRLRAYLAPVGMAKPYLVAGPEFRLFDDYHILDPDEPPIDYPDPPGGMVPGAMAGGGLMIDPGPIVGFFVEGTYTHHFGLRAEAAERGTKPTGAPAEPEGKGYTVGAVGGVQFRL